MTKIRRYVTLGKNGRRYTEKIPQRNKKKEN
jgi:hypothetical protein